MFGSLLKSLRRERDFLIRGLLYLEEWPTECREGYFGFSFLLRRIHGDSCQCDAHEALHYPSEVLHGQCLDCSDLKLDRGISLGFMGGLLPIAGFCRTSRRELSWHIICKPLDSTLLYTLTLTTLRVRAESRRQQCSQRAPMLVGFCLAGLRGPRKPGDHSTANSRARPPLPRSAHCQEVACRHLCSTVSVELEGSCP